MQCADGRNGKQLLKKLSLDLAMTTLVLLAFAYQLTGNTLHELIGLAVLGFFVVHNVVLNRRWYASLPKGKYTARRLANAAVNLLVLLAVATMIVSGLVNSHLIAQLLGVKEDVLPREIHTTAAYWFLILMSLHLGMHWRMIMAEMRRLAGIQGSNRLRAALLRVVAASIAIYGVQASLERNVHAKLIAYFSFDYWDFGESVLAYFAQYLAIIGIYACLAYYLLSWSQRRNDAAEHPPRPSSARREPV